MTLPLSTVSRRPEKNNSAAAFIGHFFSPFLTKKNSYSSFSLPFRPYRALSHSQIIFIGRADASNATKLPRKNRLQWKRKTRRRQYKPIPNDVISFFVSSFLVFLPWCRQKKNDHTSLGILSAPFPDGVAALIRRLSIKWLDKHVFGWLHQHMGYVGTSSFHISAMSLNGLAPCSPYTYLTES